MTKSELITQTAGRTGLRRRDAELAVNAALESICAALERGERVQLTGFGTFELRTNAQRPGHDPRTQEPIVIPATQVPVFRPCQGLRERVSK